MSGLDQALEHLLKSEGGWSNHPADRGGRTMYGITQATYDSFRKLKKRPLQSVRLVTKEEARELYEEMYWKLAGCDRLLWPISYIVFDAAVNSGPSRSVKWLQAALGLTADGVLGPKTADAANKVVDEGDGKKILAILDQRIVFLSRLIQRDSSQAAFLLGWWRRLQEVLAISLLEEEE